jgi:hypothetical protein
VAAQLAVLQIAIVGRAVLLPISHEIPDTRDEELKARVAVLAHLGEPITPPPLAPRARAPPEFEDTERALTLDQSPLWNLAAPPPNRGFEFNQEPGA